jgi:hypothetical protein
VHTKHDITTGVPKHTKRVPTKLKNNNKQAAAALNPGPKLHADIVKLKC